MLSWRDRGSPVLRPECFAGSGGAAADIGGAAEHATSMRSAVPNGTRQFGIHSLSSAPPRWRGSDGRDSRGVPLSGSGFPSFASQVPYKCRHCSQPMKVLVYKYQLRGYASALMRTGATSFFHSSPTAEFTAGTFCCCKLPPLLHHPGIAAFPAARCYLAHFMTDENLH